MKKSVILMFSLFFFNLNLQAQLISTTPFTTSSSGWFRVGEWSSSTRGSDRVVVCLEGGAHTPQSILIDVFKNWTGGFHMDVKGIRNAYMEQVRIVFDSGSYYLEIYFDRAISTSAHIYLYSLEGNRSDLTIYSGSLTAGGSGSINRESGNIINTTQLQNRLDLGDLTVNGVVGIGTSSTGSHKLAVEGSLGAREINVEATGWSDFVFEKDYKLRTLEEVEKYINENGHLPEIPNEEEVIENGIDLGEMNAKLLLKIEELTLYLIEEHKSNSELAEKVERLEKELKALTFNQKTR